MRDTLTEAEIRALAACACMSCINKLGPRHCETVEAVARIKAAARRETLLEAADEMDNTDDPDAIHVDNGNIDLWLRARAARIQSIEADAYVADERRLATIARVAALAERRTRVLTDLLASHEYILQFRGAICICGHVPDVNPESLKTQQDYHREHLVEVILAAGYERRRDHVAEADELRKQVRG